ncbi:MAG: S1 RNA-binding domain-containing protein, partial [Chitinophagaceae bacterium]
MSENNIVNQNAENQEPETHTESPATAATNEPGGEISTNEETPETNAKMNAEPDPVAEDATKEDISTKEEMPATEAKMDAEVKEATPQERTDEPTATKEIPAEEEKTAHDDFDWSIDKRNVSQYTDAEKEKYDKVYEDTFVQIEDGEIINGTIVGLTKTDAVLNIGFKSDGMISLNEFRDLSSVSIGDEVEVMVLEKEDRQGHLNLSRKSARIYRAWEKIMEVHKTGEVVTGIVTSKTKGGLIVDVFGMETFLPGSQIDVKPVTDYDQFVGKTMEFKVVKINETIKNAVVSHKALIESDIEAQRAEIMSKLEKGQVLEGTVKNITDFGAFMDLGGLDGLLYITDISWGRIFHPSEVLKMDQKLQVVVLDFDDDKKRISLGLKQLTPHPWDILPEWIHEGANVKGKVVNIEDYGAFLEIQPG